MVKLIRDIGRGFYKLFIAIAVVALLGGSLAIANYAVTQGSGTNFGSVVVSSVHYAQQLICDMTTPSQCAAVSAGGAVKVDNSGVTQPVSATSLPLPTGAATSVNQSTNTATTAHTCSTGGYSELGCLGQIDDDVKGAVPWLAATAWNTNTYTTGTTNPGSADLHGAPWVDIGGLNGVATLAGAGATGTGSLRVTAAQDTTTIAGSAPGTAGTASANVLSVQGVASMTKLLVTPDSVALPANQSVNVAQFGGTSTATGQVAVSTAPVTATNTALVVDLRPDSPGIIALGGATPANSVPTVSAGYTYTHITTAATTTPKSSAGVLHTVCVNALGTVASTITVDDATSATTPTIAVINSLALLGCQTFDVAFSTGLTLVTTGTVAPDVTVSWR